MKMKTTYYVKKTYKVELTHRVDEEVQDSIDCECNDGWRVIAVGVNWEDENLLCDHTGEKIQSAYGETNA
tara:strand:+ start:415 stop:624 length:210 start_codon:yes stop_codon:yes gene_type:complete